ncbi:MAG: hypothetical protein LBH08_03575 [Puniceicoccales bacterium]|nr:hypothetical protein [Puniceicoccales bacterium]
MTIGTWINGISSVPQEEKCPVIYLQNDRQVTPLERKLQVTLKELWHTFAESNPNNIENCALKLVKIQIGNNEPKNTIREILLMLLAYVKHEEDEENVQQLFSNQISTKNALKIKSFKNLGQYSQGEDELLRKLAEKLGRIIVFLKVKNGTRFNSELLTNFFEELKIYRSQKEPFKFISCERSLKDDKVRAILKKKDLGGWEGSIMEKGKPSQNASEISVSNWMKDWSDNPYGVIFLVGDYDNNFLYLLQVAPAIATEVSVSKRIAYILHNHKKTIAEVAVIALLGYIYWTNAYGIKMILTYQGDKVLNFLKESKPKIINFLKEFKEKTVNYTHGKGFKSNKQLDAERTILEKIGGFIGWGIGKTTKGIKETFVSGWKGIQKGFSN